MTASIRDLPWLPAAPEDFSARCRALGAADGKAGAAIQQLAGYALRPAQAANLGKAVARLRASGCDLMPLSAFRLGVLSNATFDLVADGLAAAAARHGVALEVVTTPYGQVMQQALDPRSSINVAGLDAVLVAVDHRGLQLAQPSLVGSAQHQVRAAIDSLRAVVNGLHDHGGAAAILQTVPTPPQALFGNYDRKVSGSLRAMIAAANEEIAGLADETGSYLLDVAALAERVGTDAWFDPVQWVSYKLPFAADCNAIYADMVGRLLGAIRGKARKCLVLDLDNTIWGGVIGDDGMQNIKVGQGDPVGEAFLAVQQYALDLRERGVILAVSSKNLDEVARQPFREHADMLLREKHIAVFQANWFDKPSNLEAIAKTLNIGLDALVLVDDNPAERAHVRAALPMVAVPELPEDPSWYPWYLAAAGYFEAVGFSSEDRIRAESYASDAERAAVMASARDVGEYLAALDMVMTIAPFDEGGRQRIAQLINKTNQFNLTTRRYTEADVAAMETDPSVHTMQVRLKDKFGELGMIAVVIARESPTRGDVVWDIDTWLMSCRVLGRKVEAAMLARLVAAARRRGVKHLTGTYVPTAKNSMVADHYTKLSFTPVAEADAGRRRFRLDIADYAAPELPMQVIEPLPVREARELSAASA